MTCDDPFELERFVSAQRGAYEMARAELQRGAKRSHWIWFIFPQVAGLGSSGMAQRYAIQSRAEAAAYLAHPVLGPRLVTCATTLLAHADKSVADIMGHPDDLKLRSSMTLFAAVSGPGSPMQAVLDAFYDGAPDERTLAFLARPSPPYAGAPARAASGLRASP